MCRLTDRWSRLYKACIPTLVSTPIQTSKVETAKMISKVVRKISVIIKRRLSSKINVQKPRRLTGLSQEEMDNANNEAVEDNLKNTFILMKMAV